MTENSLTAGYETLGADINKMPGRDEMETQEGVVSPKLPELTLEMEDEELAKLNNKRKKTWEESDVKSVFDKNGKENEKYYLGKQFTGPQINEQRPMVDNLIFESLETYLPQVTRRNPDPMVEPGKGVDPNDQNAQALARQVKEELGELADQNKLRLKLKGVAQHWAIYLLGILKYSWDVRKNMPVVKVVRAKKIILDPEATIDEDGYTGEYIGEYRGMIASKLLSIMEQLGGTPEGTKKINDLISKKDKGTKIQFIEWWTDEYMCWQIDETILLKVKNPNWNYDKPAEPTSSVDDYGNEIQIPGEVQPGRNHFQYAQKPYSFLSIYNLGEQPVDKTSLIGQNLSNQDLLNKRNKQITKNADSMNGGVVISLARSGLTETQAKGVSKALEDGGAIAIPDGEPLEAVTRLPAPGLPADIYNQLQDTRMRMRDIFGTRGSSTAGLEGTDTVRGKILSRGLDTDRIGGGISEYLEQLADSAYNWFLQLKLVYDDKYVALAQIPALDISVKEGSLLPKDSTTIANQAIELCTGGKMSILDMYKRLEYPNPEELAANVWLEINAPQVLYGNDPRVAQVVQQQQQAAQAQAPEQKPPSLSMSFKDLPPEGQVQMAAQAGIQLSPEALAAHAAIQNTGTGPPGGAPSNGKTPAGPAAINAVPISNA